MSEMFETVEHNVDLCVVGGGMAGLIAAVSAARRGAQVLLMQDRPVLGGNASSEVRMWICGARGAQAKETGLLEEIMLRNLYRNRTLKYPLWDTVLYETARYQPGLTLLLNCACSQVFSEERAHPGGQRLADHHPAVSPGERGFVRRLLGRFGAARLRRRFPPGTRVARRVQRVACPRGSR